MTSVLELKSHGPEDTELVAERLGRACEGGELLLLSGELGAGKTCFARGLARGLGCDPRSVKSPSYTLLLRYPGTRRLNHFDVYFTEHFEDLVRSGLFEALDAGEVAVVEWGERFLPDLPPDRLTLELAHEGLGRRGLRFQARGPRSRAWLARAALGPQRESR